jgi:hypothetical protein
MPACHADVCRRLDWPYALGLAVHDFSLHVKFLVVPRSLVRPIIAHLLRAQAAERLQARTARRGAGSGQSESNLLL